MLDIIILSVKKSMSQYLASFSRNFILTILSEGKNIFSLFIGHLSFYIYCLGLDKLTNIDFKECLNSTDPDTINGSSEESEGKIK